MTSYLIPNLTAGQVQTLQAAGLGCHIVDLSSNSYIVESEGLGPVQQLLKARAETSASEFENIVAVTLEYYEVLEANLVTFEGTKVLVERNGQSLPKARFVRLIEEKVGPLVGRQIVLHLTPSGDKPKRKRAPFYDDYFHIHIWSAPQGKRQFTPPAKIWKTDVDCRNKSFGSTGLGIPLMDKSSEYAVGAIVANNLYVHHNLFSCYSDNEYDLLKIILEKAADDLNLSPAKIAERKLERRREGLAKSRLQYIKICSERTREMVKEAGKTFRARAKSIPPLQNALLRLLRLDLFGNQFPPTAGLNAERRSEFTAEYERLTQVPRIKSVIARQNLVSLRTEALHARDPRSGQNHELGEFLIVINLQGGEAPVRWFNTMRRVDGVRVRMNAPNIYANGTPMLEEIQETMLELIARLELSVVAELAIQFVETVTDDYPFTHLNKWPLAAQQG